MGMARAQSNDENIVPMSFDTVGADTARAAAIIDRYIKMLDFSQLHDDSVLCVKTYVIDRSHPFDTITIKRWYMRPRYNRTEIWQGGRMEDGYHSDGVKLFRKFHTGRREWANLTPDSYYEVSLPLDIRGALYDWRTKGGEAFYAGEMVYKGVKVDRVFVTMPELFDRYYFFEHETGLLGFLVEEPHIYGDREPARNAVRVDWKAWHEFVPVKGLLLPKEESYQVGGDQIVILYHSYHFEAPQKTMFTEDFYMAK
jgi:hypothetical protein